MLRSRDHTIKKRENQTSAGVSFVGRTRSGAASCVLSTRARVGPPSMYIAALYACLIRRLSRLDREGDQALRAVVDLVIAETLEGIG